jgi:hypothetical protein
MKDQGKIGSEVHHQKPSLHHGLMLQLHRAIDAQIELSSILRWQRLTKTEWKVQPLSSRMICLPLEKALIRDNVVPIDRRL